jgi:hypothetical protein
MSSPTSKRIEWDGRAAITAAGMRRSIASNSVGRLGKPSDVATFSLINTLIKVCPLLGLLGTVVGMLEVFDALAATGSNNPRSMAAGVSKATVSTLAGMVVAIVGLLAASRVSERHAIERSASKLPGPVPADWRPPITVRDFFSQMQQSMSTRKAASTSPR